MEIKLVSKDEVLELIFGSGLFNPGTPAIVTLFGGDRLSCIDEAVVLEEDGQVVGLATIAPRGEFGAGGQPAIVGVYVRHLFRGSGYGKKIMIATIKRMLERGLEPPYRADAVSTPGRQICEGLPPEYREKLDIHDFTMGGLMDLIMLW